MKRALYILTFIYSTLTFAQESKEKVTYIQKDSAKGHSQSIFYETNKRSKFYKALTSFTIDSFTKDNYNNSLDYLKKKQEVLIKQKTILPSSKWIELKQYKSKFYVYYPCDFYTQFQISINDSTYIDWTGEGPDANKILNQVKVDNSTYMIGTTGIFEPNRVVRVNIIDNKKGIAVFEEIIDGQTSKYQLMIMIETVKLVPFIINNCETQKQVELDFEEPDFKKLLKRN